MAGGNRKGRWVAVTLGAVAVVAALVLLIGGSEGSSKPFTYSVKETRKSCSSPIYLPQKEAESLLDRPRPKDWTVVQNWPGGAYANQEIVELHLEAGTAKEVTLEDIHFHIKRGKRPKGETFYPPCYNAPKGWLMVSNFDEKKPRVVIYNTDLGEENLLRLPWTAELQEPLTLNLRLLTYRCYCIWTADIPWATDSAHGTIHISEGKKKFVISYTGGMPAHMSTGNGWS